MRGCCLVSREVVRARSLRRSRSRTRGDGPAVAPQRASAARPGLHGCGTPLTAQRPTGGSSRAPRVLLPRDGCSRERTPSRRARLRRLRQTEQVRRSARLRESSGTSHDEAAAFVHLVAPRDGALARGRRSNKTPTRCASSRCGRRPVSGGPTQPHAGESATAPSRDVRTDDGCTRRLRRREARPIRRTGQRRYPAS